MIELPEAEVITAQIRETLVGKTVQNTVAAQNPHAFAWYTGDPADYHDKLQGKTITGASAGGHYTCGGNMEIYLDDMVLVITTPIRYYPPGTKLPPKHQLMLEFTDFSAITCSVQMWGAMFCFQKDDKTGIPKEHIINPQPSPLEDAFNHSFFMELFHDTPQKYSVKAFLATEQRIPGVGNGVCQDVFFRAGIHPKKKLMELSQAEKDLLFECFKVTLLEMTAQGGRDTERDLYGVFGGYKTILSKKTVGAPCAQCGEAIIREPYLGGNIYFCPACQPYRAVNAKQ